jgi:hypothetical protein
MGLTRILYTEVGTGDGKRLPGGRAVIARSRTMIDGVWLHQACPGDTRYVQAIAIGGGCNQATVKVGVLDEMVFGYA